MVGIYGHKWTSAFGDDPGGIGGKQWALTLAGLSRASIDTGLDACRNSTDEWPPTAPQFKARCLDIPSSAFVRHDLGTRSHGFTRMVWEHIEPWRFSHANTREAEQQFRDAYAVAVERRMQGEAFPVEPPAIEHVKRPYVPADQPTARQALKAIKAALKAAGEIENTGDRVDD